MTPDERAFVDAEVDNLPDHPELCWSPEAASYLRGDRSVPLIAVLTCEKERREGDLDALRAEVKRKVFALEGEAI